MNARQMEELLFELISGEAGRYTDDDESLSIRTYEDAGILTRDNGLVVRDSSGSEFQITIVRSR